MGSVVAKHVIVAVMETDLGKALDKITGKLSDLKLYLSESSSLFEFDSDDMAQFLLWIGDLEFIQRLVNEFAYDHGLRKTKPPPIRFNHQFTAPKISVELLEEEWIGRKHGQANTSI